MSAKASPVANKLLSFRVSGGLEKQDKYLDSNESNEVVQLFMFPNDPDDR